MINQNEYIPEHLQSRWQEVKEELAISSQEVNEANKRYNLAIIARLALNEALREWQQSQ